MNNCIYKISSYCNGKIYIGSAINPVKRKSFHFKTLERGTHHNIKLQRHYNKYGKSDLSFEIIENDILKERLIEREQYYIDKLNPSFNICKIAGSAIGRKCSESSNNKRRLKLKGLKYSAERCMNMSKARKGVKPKPFTDEHKANMSKGMIGKKKKPFTEERKQKLRDIWKQKKLQKSSILL